MAVKRLDVDGIGPVVLMKRRGTRSVRITLPHSGEVRVTMPTWAPYQVGIDFVKSKTDWIQAQTVVRDHLAHKRRIGKAHHLVFVRTDITSPTSRIVGNEVRVSVPSDMDQSDPAVQQCAEKAAIRTLKKEAEGLLPYRLKQLAATHGFTYRSVAIKRLSGRWGSCSSQKDIVLNCYLMELPWHLIDYVLLHELVHTRIMAHGPVFWDEMAKYVPNLSLIRKEMKTHRPVL